MRFLFILALAFISNSVLASSWEFRTAKSLEGLSIQPWHQYPKSGNPIAREYEGFIEYKSEIISDNEIFNSGLYLGLIGDADKTYVNGVQVGQTGNFPPNFTYNMDTERTYFLTEGVVKKGLNEIRIVVYSRFLVNKGFNPNTFKIAPTSELDSTKYVDELKNNLSKIVIPILCLVLTVVSFPLLAPKHLWNSQLMIFLIGLSSFVLGLCRGRIGYHFFEMVFVYKVTLISSVLTIWLVTIFKTKSCKSWLRFLPTMISASLITSILVSNSLIEAAAWGRIWFHISPIFLITALYGDVKSSGVRTLKSFGLIILIVTNINDNLNDLRIISTVSLLQYGLGIFIASMIIDQLLGLKRSWEKYFMKEAQLEIDAELGKQALHIAHDLRSPIESIRESIGRLQNISSEDANSLNLGLLRMNEICQSLLRKSSFSEKQLSLPELISDIQTIVKETQHKYSAHPNLKLLFYVSESNRKVTITVDQIRLKRAVCNLINNSIEAINLNGEVKISIHHKTQDIEISIEDNGKGLSVPVEQLLTRGYTTKVNGNGLGLSSTKEFVETLGGSIHLVSLEEGTKVTLKIPCTDMALEALDKEKTIVLIDDDDLVRLNWKRQGLLKNIQVHAFDNFDTFIDVHGLYSLDTPIFIDSNLGQERGELLSAKLCGLGYQSVYLTTGLPKNAIHTKKWVKDIVCKSFDAAVLPKLYALTDVTSF